MSAFLKSRAQKKDALSSIMKGRQTLLLADEIQILPACNLHAELRSLGSMWLCRVGFRASELLKGFRGSRF